MTIYYSFKRTSVSSNYRIVYNKKLVIKELVEDNENTTNSAVFKVLAEHTYSDITGKWKEKRFKNPSLDYSPYDLSTLKRLKKVFLTFEEAVAHKLLSTLSTKNEIAAYIEELNNLTALSQLQQNLLDDYNKNHPEYFI